MKKLALLALIGLTHFSAQGMEGVIHRYKMDLTFLVNLPLEHDGKMIELNEKHLRDMHG